MPTVIPSGERGIFWESIAGSDSNSQQKTAGKGTSMSIPQESLPSEGNLPRPYEDVRQWLDLVESMGELKRINGADWNLEIGTMHTLLIKASVLDKDPWIAMSIYNAWQESKKKCYQWLEWQRVHQTSLWYRALWEEERAAAGPDTYLWGFRKTRPEVDKLLEYCHRQGLTTRKFDPEEMFHPSTLST